MRVLNEDVVRLAGVTAADLAVVEGHERSEVERRADRYHGGRPMIPLAGRTVILVDDGVATGGPRGPRSKWRGRTALST